MDLKKVLLADDDADDREIFELALQKRSGVSLLGSVENGREVIEYLRNMKSPEELPHLIILDHNMPKMNGTETLDALKSNEKYSSIHVVIYSTYSDHNLVQRCTQLGAAMVLAKPSNLKDYEAVIDKFLGILS